jgi:hypothetical protein
METTNLHEAKAKENIITFQQKCDDADCPAYTIRSDYITGITDILSYALQ